MATRNPLSQHPTYICDYCGSLFEQGDEMYKDEESNDMCEECWHEENNHAQCDECGEWIVENAVHDEEDDKVFCNEECHISYYPAYLSHIAGILKDEKYERSTDESKR